MIPVSSITALNFSPNEINFYLLKILETQSIKLPKQWVHLEIASTRIAARLPRASQINAKKSPPKTRTISVINNSEKTSSKPSWTELRITFPTTFKLTMKSNLKVTNLWRTSFFTKEPCLQELFWKLKTCNRRSTSRTVKLTIFTNRTSRCKRIWSKFLRSSKNCIRVTRPLRSKGKDCSKVLNANWSALTRRSKKDTS